MIADEFDEIGKRYRELVGRPFFEAEGTKPAEPKPVPTMNKCQRDCGIKTHGVIRMCDRSCYAL